MAARPAGTPSTNTVIIGRRDPGEARWEMVPTTCTSFNINDTHNSATSILSNSGHTGGGYDSFYIRDIDGGIVGVAGAGEFTMFSTSATPGVGMNLGNSNATVPTNHVAFTMAPSVGFQTMFESISMFTGGKRRERRLQCQQPGQHHAGWHQYRRTAEHERHRGQGLLPGRAAVAEIFDLRSLFVPIEVVQE